MANSKISALTSATTPLAGTETLPIVQGSTTKQVSVANLTAGRAVSMLSGTITDSIATPVPLNINNDNAGTSAGTRVNWQFNGTTVGYVGNQFDGADFTNLYNTNRFHIFTVGGTEYFRIVNADATIKSGNLIFGTASKGVNFTANTPSAGMTSQLMNWYEEGTWTPADASGAGLTFTSVTAKYTRIGNQITATCVLTYPVTASVLAAKISGLPFAAGNMGQFLVIKTSVAGAGQGLVTAGSSTINFYNQSGAAVTNATYTTSTLNFTGTYFV